MKGYKKMGWFIRGWRSVLVSLMPVGLVLVACSSASDGSNTAVVAAPQGGPTAVVNLYEQPVASSDRPVGHLTINVDVTDEGFQPTSIFIPVGQRVQLVLRNRGNAEHHFKVLGLVPKDPMWLARAKPGVYSDEEHVEHHSGASFVDATSLMLFNMCSSVAGICPNADEVHAYAAGGGIDAVFFTATKIGTFLVQDPLHPGIVGKLIVF